MNQKKETSLKKNNEFDSPETLIESEIKIEQNEINKILLKHHNDNTISLLTGIKNKYGRDIYDKIRVFLSN